jgi:hypothetical protein
MPVAAIIVSSPLEVKEPAGLEKGVQIIESSGVFYSNI